MATGAQVAERLSPLTGQLYSTLFRQLRAQQVAGQVPMAGKGGGKSAAHFEARHLAAVLIGLAADRPGDAPEAFEKLAGADYYGCRYPPVPPQPTLHAMVASLIEDAAAGLLGKHPVKGPIVTRTRSMTLTLCLKPAQAFFEIDGDSPDSTLIYVADVEPSLAIHRHTILDGDLMIAAGELLADTITWHASVNHVVSS